jgi:hypothetical protein
VPTFNSKEMKMSKVSELVEGNWYLILDEKNNMVAVHRCLKGKLGGIATVSVIEDMNGSVHDCVVMTIEEFEAAKDSAYEDGRDSVL